jgi:hypothetical protein
MTEADRLLEKLETKCFVCNALNRLFWSLLTVSGDTLSFGMLSSELVFVSVKTSRTIAELLYQTTYRRQRIDIGMADPRSYMPLPHSCCPAMTHAEVAQSK